MSCMRNVDPYNNLPPPRNNPGQQPKNMNEQYSFQQYQPQQMQQQPPQPQQLNQQTENFMLRADLQTAIQYIYQLGGTWPPPGK